MTKAMLLLALLVQAPKERNYPYRELEGVVEEFHFSRNWRHYYWREDFTLLLRDDRGTLHRVISREPTPWAGHRLGTTYTGLPVDWTARPRVRVIGVQAIDRDPPDFYHLKLDPAATVTAFIVRVQLPGQKDWRDYFINNWFHRWGAETDRKMLAHYANDDPHCTIYGYLGGAVAPFDSEGKQLLAKYPDANIFHARVVPAKNAVGYELKVIHLLGRDRKTARYGPFHGDPATLVKLDGKAPPAPVELVGKARGFKAIRDWQSYYWRDDFHFTLDADDGKTWKIISREPTPAYHWRMGPTRTSLKVDWSKNPRVKVVGIAGVDRLPPKFHDLKLDDKYLATVLVLYVETKPGQWTEYYVNNWFHKWGDRVDAAIHKLYAGKKVAYDVYGFIAGQVAPFSKEARAIIAKHPKARMFHGLIRETKDNPFGYEIELLQLVGPDAGGNGVVYHGDRNGIPLLDGKK